jgi:hypothetical protein
MRSSVSRFDFDRPLIRFDRCSKFACGLQPNSEIHVRSRESVVYLQSLTVILEGLGSAAGCLCGDATI